MGDPTSRHLLPQVAERVAPHAPERREPQRSYVFVDEQNRHRRLKVVRACAGCRKRKIKCDAANTNTWPCSACLRLKMTCVPPTMGFDSDKPSETQSTNITSSTLNNNEETAQYTYAPPIHLHQHSYNDGSTSQVPRPHYQHDRQPSLSKTTALSGSQALMYAPKDTLGYSHPEPATIAGIPPARVGVNAALKNNGTSYQAHAESGAVDGITGGLGTVNLESITNIAVAPYMVHQQGFSVVSALPDDEIALPLQVSSDISIPPEMMPPDEVADEYFYHFFENIHPYVPVLNQSHFCHLWRTERHAISPLILEAIFACSAFSLKQPMIGRQWLALAQRHEEGFKDKPLLDTIQGLLLVLKAREALPKRGYYYRSWLSVVNLVAMAKDLEIDQHWQRHQNGEACGAGDDAECATRTRVWHMLFAVELIIGGPQGKTDYSVAVDTVNFDPTARLPGVDAEEIQVFQNFTQFIRCIRNVRTSSMIYNRLRKKKTDWATDYDFVRHNVDFDSWLVGLPSALQITYPADKSEPRLESHYVANLHAYHNLSILIHHRPQLVKSFTSMEGSWKSHMVRCSIAAKNICRLQEAILDKYGLGGLLYMLRGVNFHIYAILTCTCIHQVSLTNPDPEIYHDAAEYFKRHMRLLEQCSSSWPLPEMQNQIETLRQAFSADLSKPFELKANLLYGSPSSSDSFTPSPKDTTLATQEQDHTALAPPYTAYAAAASPIGEQDFQAEYPQSLMNPVQPLYAPATSSVAPSQYQVHWNPTPLFDQWSGAFGPAFGIQSDDAAHSPSQQVLPLPAHTYPAQQQLQKPTYIGYGSSVPVMAAQPERMMYLPQQAQMPAYTAASPQSHVTASTWHEAIAISFGQKRRWNGGSTNSSNKRAR